MFAIYGTLATLTHDVFLHFSLWTPEKDRLPRLPNCSVDCARLVEFAALRRGLHNVRHLRVVRFHQTPAHDFEGVRALLQKHQVQLTTRIEMALLCLLFRDTKKCEFYSIPPAGISKSDQRLVVVLWHTKKDLSCVVTIPSSTSLSISWSMFLVLFAIW